MNNQFSLAYLTVQGCEPLGMIEIAARCGYDAVGLRLIPMGLKGEHPTSPEDKGLIRKIKSALRDTGMTLLDIEVARIMENLDLEQYLPALESAGELGARHVIASVWAENHVAKTYIVDQYVRLCELAKPFGLTVDLEFPSFSSVNNLADALDIVRVANQKNSGLLIDTLYLYFAGIGPDELMAIPRDKIHFIHVNDTTSDIPDSPEGMRHIAREDRLYLGDGSIDFEPILKALPQVPLSIELPNKRRVEVLGYEEHARRCLESARRTIKSFQPSIDLQNRPERAPVSPRPSSSDENHL